MPKTSLPDQAVIGPIYGKHFPIGSFAVDCGAAICMDRKHDALLLAIFQHSTQIKYKSNLSARCVPALAETHTFAPLERDE
jgi:hypothetical protein